MGSNAFFIRKRLIELYGALLPLPLLALLLLQAHVFTFTALAGFAQLLTGTVLLSVLLVTWMILHFWEGVPPFTLLRTKGWQRRLGIKISRGILPLALLIMTLWFILRLFGFLEDIVPKPQLMLLPIFLSLALTWGLISGTLHFANQLGFFISQKARRMARYSFLTIGLVLYTMILMQFFSWYREMGGVIHVS